MSDEDKGWLPEGEMKQIARIKQAYARGRADREKELLGGEPDGWCAWSEEKGWHFMSDGNAMIRKTTGYRGPLTGGYRYVPVKLVVLDDKSPVDKGE
jgi:hypothetical protein